MSSKRLSAPLLATDDSCNKYNVVILYASTRSYSGKFYHMDMDANADSTTQRSWVDRLPKFIAGNPKGIDAWPTGCRNNMTTLSRSYFIVRTISSPKGNDVGRYVDLYKSDKYLGTLHYGPRQAWRSKRRLLETKYNV